MKLSLRSRLALLFAACTASVSLIAGLLFDQASARHFMELDQHLFDSRLANLRATLGEVTERAAFEARRPALHGMTEHAELHLRITDSHGQVWLDDTPALRALPASEGLHTLNEGDVAYRVLNTRLQPQRADSPRVSLLLDITHHQQFLQGMQRLIWLTVGLCALATALLGAWAARRALQPLQRMGEVASGVSASSLAMRLPEQAMPPELAQLAVTFNAMLDRLEQGFQRLSAFSADIAHELRSPLSNLLTQTQVVLSQPRALDDYRQALLGNLEELQGLTQLVNDMLLLAKADQGLLTPGRDALRLEDEVDSVLEYFMPLAEDAGVGLSRQGQATLQGDRMLLRRVLANLLGNALRFTAPGKRVEVKLQGVDEAVELSVENPGPDMPPEVLGRLFDRFYRADPARSGGHEHAGLGLAISRSIVEAHGGTLRCESALGLTRFVVRLPLGHS
ncbi:heavy metal sensor histidine kinase [Pseudomonas sp. DTU_2021_1001937_2_SI_NGA_ILE_001]|uniref:heavy metal sensor histidine kinase n=1 Tax=Pseudomonas sp. DTU_2021_1001937_2_SI_NGA_ILE_001 TaxID=3077589 RepID=UPI0028FC254D|nr:heavy metal sensor histidine kinase [Pseudomonas sp. DTU_2021_1001937_2_SI_NGA_ILE_001]WNW10862.1 heavy metal sensor histidine kinase [Pseudomonas sp. DTU_2021_1001937_2_SI_NGA_ILE_001]